jgi:hypothetical protein
MGQMLFCWIAVFQYVSVICQYGASDNAFESRRVAKLAVSMSLVLSYGSLFHM